MKKVSLNVQKWGVRALVAIGALLGISSCSHKIDLKSVEGVYGPPPVYTPPKINVVEDVYGPPVERIDSVVSTEEPELKQDNNLEL